MKHLQILALSCPTSVCASAATLCNPDEGVVFICPTKSGKQIAVCATKDAVRYRYGSIGKIELEAVNGSFCTPLQSRQPIYQ